MIGRRALLAGAAGALSLSLGLSAAHAVGDLSDVGEQSFSDIASCAASSETLLVSIVVDESGSLTETDPDNRRVTAIETALDSLEQLGDTPDLTVEATLAVFGEDFSELVGWGAVEGDQLESLRTATTDQLPDRNRARYTDYRLALTQAQSSLADRAVEVDQSACKMLLWFTDGRLDVDDGADPALTEAARTEICEPGGIIDSVRADDVSVIALGLLTSEEDRDPLQAIAEGTAGAETCGTTPVSDSVTNGAFLYAEDAGALDRIFAQTGALIEGASGEQSVVCPSADCPEGRLEIPVDEGIAGFRLVLQGEEGAALPHLFSPDGQNVELDSSVVEIGGSEASVRTPGTLRTVDVRDLSDNIGTWNLETDPSTTTSVDLYYFWGVTLTAEAPEGLVIGEARDVHVIARDAAGDPVDLSVFETAQLTATIGDESVDFDLSDGAWTAEVEVPMGDAVASLPINGRATAVTAPHQIELGPIFLEQSLETEFPPTFPTITPSQIDLGRLADSTTETVTLTVSGADRGTTEVHVRPGELEAPVGAGDVRLSSAEDRYEIEAGAEVEVPITFEASEAADGRIGGTLPVQLRGVEADDVIDVAIPVTGTMVRPVDESTRWTLVAAFALLALAIAWAAAVITRRALNRFIVSKFARYAEVPVIVSAGGVTRRDRSGTLLTADEFRARPPDGHTTSLRLGPARYSMRYPLNPLAEARAVVTGANGEVPITDRLETTQNPAERLVNLSQHAGFVIITERPDEPSAQAPLDGTLVVVLDPGERGRQSHADLLPDRLEQIAQIRWPQEVERVHRAWQDLTPKKDEPTASTRRSSSAVAKGTADDDHDTPPAPSPPPRRGASEGSPTSDQSPRPPRRRGSSAGSDSPPSPSSQPRRSGETSSSAGDRPPPRRRPSDSNSPPPRRSSTDRDNPPPPRR